jgi:branched-chain amino acid transport system ATP-binding protein
MYLSTLDEITNGRVVCGVGAGALEYMDWLGIEHGRPLTRTRECVELIRKLISGSSAEYHGSEFTWDKQCYMRFKPVRNRIPIYIGSQGDRMLEYSGEAGDGALPLLYPPDFARYAVGMIRGGAKKAGRDPAEIAGCVWISVSEDRQDAITEGLKELVAYFGPLQGEFVGIIGPNGAGKSTFAEALFGLVDVFEGKVIFNGEDITRLRTELRVKMGMGYVPQLDNVFQDLSVLENLEMGGVSLDSKTRNALTNTILSVFPELKPKLSDKAKVLSGGERQMLAVGRALMTKPKLLVLDEPSAGLSPVMCERLFKGLSEINEMGVTLLIVEQNIKRIENVVHRVAVFVQGKKVFEGRSSEIDPDQLISTYFGTANKTQ